MDEKVLKWIARCFAVLTVVVCISLVRFPDMTEWIAQQRQRRIEAEQARAEEEARKEAEMTAQIEVLMERRAQEVENQRAEEETEPEEKIAGVIHDETEALDAQLRVELPEGVKAAEVKVTNRYIDRIVRIRFPSELADYFSRYRVQGSSDGITGMNYYHKEKEGTLELETDGIYEIYEKVKGGCLYLDLISPREIYDKIVVIDAGHGADKLGAVREGVEEKNLNLAIVQQVKTLMEQHTDQKIGVFYTRLKDEDITLEQRVGLANALKADLFISIHNNSTASTSAAAVLHGTQVLYDESDHSTHSSKDFAQICLEEMTSALGSKEMGLLKGDDIYIIRNSQMPVALIEVGFMTYAQELAQLQTEDYQKKAAQGIYNSILRAIREGY